MQGATLTLAAVVLAAWASAAAADKAQCGIPNVYGVDQSPTKPKDWGKCTDALDPDYPRAKSHWCKFNDLGYWPSPPSNGAKKCMKFGRMTIYRGPIYGSSPAHKGACNKWLKGSSDMAMVAVSTKYLRTTQSGWASDKGACGKCMCVRMHGADLLYSPGLQKENAAKHIGLTFMAKVGDRCSECEDDHIDVLLDRPLAYAPFDPKNAKNNQWAPYVNAKPGYRGFGNPSYMRGHAHSPENVGVWVADWQWVPCSYTHDRCVAMMGKMGYDNTFKPEMTPGVDSYSLRTIDNLRTAPQGLKAKPWGLQGE